MRFLRKIMQHFAKQIFTPNFSSENIYLFWRNTLFRIFLFLRALWSHCGFRNLFSQKSFRFSKMDIYKCPNFIFLFTFGNFFTLFIKKGTNDEFTCKSKKYILLKLFVMHNWVGAFCAFYVNILQHFVFTCE